jgi:DNA-nicking Smr family endonuclease
MTSSLGRRRSRRLSEEERRLWETVAASVDPLVAADPRRRVEADSIAPPVVAPEPAVPAPTPAPAPAAPRVPQILRPTGPTRHGAGTPMIHVKHGAAADGLAPAIVAPPSLARFDQRTKRRLVRGSIAIDERLDLHGYTEAAAHSLLRGFLISARARGARIVLVITGKGQGPGKDRGRALHERGVLRRAVPHWLSDPSLRDVVLGWEEAHLAHGGAGAIYVRLRRIRPTGEGER